MTLYDLIATIKPEQGGMSPHNRIWCELKYGADLSTARGGVYDELLSAAAERAHAILKENGALGKSDVLQIEAMLAPMAGVAKEYIAHCIGHAHIDMNWMWGYNETACVTLDTFRTVLKLMDEYPDFTFAQSQASTYKIIEENAPEMIGEIKRRVAEGRWEANASTWVENDKNMPTGEALCRHILYTKRYLSKLLALRPEDIEMDFEPDTFGHAESVPEICARGGVKYYYHCRGLESDTSAYVWRSDSGSELLVYFEPHWYNTQIEPELFCDYPQRCLKYALNEFLVVYGVGDHGGGPTRRDIERLIEIDSWPIMPRIRFSTYSRFFKRLETVKEKLPIVTGELNYTFTGCYTSQSRIKLADSISQARMNETEALNAASVLLAGGSDHTPQLDRAWEDILFNQFHDILPGSGTIETREYAMGNFQRAMAAIQTGASCSFASLSRAMKLPACENGDTLDTFSDGAGVGFKVGEDGSFTQPSSGRGRGKTRYFRLFNPSASPFEGVSEITVWDWPYDRSRAVFTDEDGAEIESAFVEAGERYWTHAYKTYALRVSVPAFGFRTVVLSERSLAVNRLRFSESGRCDLFGDGEVVLENDVVRAVFDSETMLLKSFRRKDDDKELVLEGAGAFLFIKENAYKRATAWRVGERMACKNLNRDCAVKVIPGLSEKVRKSLRYSMAFGQSKLDVTVTLDAGSSLLKYRAVCDFREAGEREQTPQIFFEAPVGYDAKRFRYDIPYGTVVRGALDHDVPALSFGCALRGEEGGALAILSDAKHGFRGDGRALGLNLLRGTSDPDPYPEMGLRTLSFALAAAKDGSADTLLALSDAVLHPVSVCAAEPNAEAKLPMKGSLLAARGARIGAVKLGEGGKSLVVRLVNYDLQESAFAVETAFPLLGACEADINETPAGALAAEGNKASGTIGARQVKTILLRPVKG